jgi:acyl carrier protein
MKYHNKELDEKLVKILKETFKTNEINAEATMEQIPAWDSMKHFQMVTAVEKEFNIEINISDTFEMASIPAIKDKILKYLNDR